MKRNVKITVGVIAAIILILGCIIAVIINKDKLYDLYNPPFEETAIFP